MGVAVPSQVTQVYQVNNDVGNNPNLEVISPTFPEVRLTRANSTQPDGRWRWVILGDNVIGLQPAADGPVFSSNQLSGFAFRNDWTRFLYGVTSDNGFSALQIRPGSGLISSLTTSGLGMTLNVPVATVVMDPTTPPTTVYNVALGIMSLSRNGVTLDSAATLYIAGAPAAVATLVITEALALHVDDGNSRFDGNVLIDGAFLVRANSATKIGFCVTNAAVVLGSLGSLIIPVRVTGDDVDGTDAEIGDQEGAIYYNRFSTSLNVRTSAVDTTVKVGLAGTIIPCRAPEVAGGQGLYHYNQRLGIYTPEGREYVDETVCVECGQEFQVGDALALKANAVMETEHGQDLHAIYQHLHLEQEGVFKGLLREVDTLSTEVQTLHNRLRELEERESALAAA